MHNVLPAFCLLTCTAWIKQKPPGLGGHVYRVTCVLHPPKPLNPVPNNKDEDEYYSKDKGGVRASHGFVFTSVYRMWTCQNYA